jgi:DNA-binding NarL/FixJ family response regulator
MRLFEKNWQMIQVAIADDHAVVRQAMTLLLEKTGEFRVVFESDTLAKTLRKLQEYSCDVLLLDLNLPDSNGLHTVEQIRRTFPKLNILVLSAYPEEEFAARAFETGANAYLHKSVAMPELCRAIRKVASGGSYIGKKLEEVLPYGLPYDESKKDVDSLSLLSEREFDVLRLIGAGLTNKEIALRLNISTKTVYTYRARIMEKLNIDSSTLLLRFALEHQFHLPL